MKFWLKSPKSAFFIITAVLVSGFLFPHKSQSYGSSKVHPDLTREVLIFYEAETGNKLTEEQKQWIIKGVQEEDFAPRWLNHFYDPSFERGLSTGIAGINGYSAKNWAQYSSYQSLNLKNVANLWTGEGPAFSGSWLGDFSYEAGIKSYSQGKEKEAYISLGHLLHLVEDMTVPEHTRNDPHLGDNILVSHYETYTDKNSASLTDGLARKLAGEGRKPAECYGLPSCFGELAVYTNSHFFSPATINSDLYQKPKIVFNDGTFAYGYDENYQLFDLATVENKSYEEVSYSLKNPQIAAEYWIRLSRKAVLYGSGIMKFFINEAEAAKKVELAKQEADRQNSSGSSFLGFISGIFGFNQPKSDDSGAALTITSEPKQAEKPKATAVVTPKSQNIPPAAAPKTKNPTPESSPAKSNSNSPAVQAPKANQANNAQNPPSGSDSGQQSAANNSNSSQSNQNNSSANYSGGGVSNQQNVNPVAPLYHSGDMVINEIMYNLSGADDKREWIEIYNNAAFVADLSGWKINDGDGDTNHVFNAPPKNGGQGSTAIAPGRYAILTDDGTTFLADHPGFSGTVIDTVMNLKNSTTTVKIIGSDGTVTDETTYCSSWGGDGNGKTLSRKSASGSSADPANWSESLSDGGTPGVANDFSVALGNLVGDNASTTPDSATSTPSLGTDIAETVVINGSETWNLSGSPYRLFFNNLNWPKVAPGASLTIEPGVKVIPQGSGNIALEIEGSLTARGTGGNPIIFTSITDADGISTTTPQKGDWSSIVFSNGSQANLDYVEFRYGGKSGETEFREMVKIAGATANINHSKFLNSQKTALHVLDSDVTVENSVFSDNYCGISVDSSNGGAMISYGGCFGVHNSGDILSPNNFQIRNNQFVRNGIALEIRSGTSPAISNNDFTDNNYPVMIESSYPAIAGSQLSNSTASPGFSGGITVSGYTQFSHSFTLKKDLPYILETNGPIWSPRVKAGAVLTLEPGIIIKPNNKPFASMYVDGQLVASATPENPIIFTSFLDDSRGGDTNGDNSAGLPQDNDWRPISFSSNSRGEFQNTSFLYGVPGNTDRDQSVDILDKSEAAGEMTFLNSDFSQAINQQFTAEADTDDPTIVFWMKSNTDVSNISRVLILADSGDEPGPVLCEVADFGVLTEFPNQQGSPHNCPLRAGSKYWVRFSKINPANDSNWIFKSHPNNFGRLVTGISGAYAASSNPGGLCLKVTATETVSLPNALELGGPTASVSFR